MILKSMTSNRKTPCLSRRALVKVGVKPWKKHLESFTALFGILSYIISEKTEDYGNF